MIKYNGVTSNVQYYRGNKVFNYVKGGPRTPNRSEYLTLENIASTQAQFYLCVFNTEMDISDSVSISTDGTNWSTLTWSNDTYEWHDRDDHCRRSLITIAAGGKVMFKTLKDIHNEDGWPPTGFSFSNMTHIDGQYVDPNSGTIVCYGNPMSLWAVNFQTHNSLHQNSMTNFFGDDVYASINVVDASGLWMGNNDTHLGHGAVRSMFRDCYNLTYPPQLPSMNFSGGWQCTQMFRNTGIMYAPDLPSLKLSDHTYAEMFRDCRNLAKGPVFGNGNEVIAGGQSINNIFQGCSNLTQIPDATFIFTDGGDEVLQHIFDGCSSLTDLSGIHFKVLGSFGYYAMDSICEGCTSLVHAPYIEITGSIFPGEAWRYVLGNAFVNCYALTDIILISAAQDLIYSVQQIYDGGENPPTPANCRFICGVGANWVEGTEFIEDIEYDGKGYPQGWVVERRKYGDPTTVSIDA